jgi:hypothetical protein
VIDAVSAKPDGGDQSASTHEILAGDVVEDRAVDTTRAEREAPSVRAAVALAAHPVAVLPEAGRQVSSREVEDARVVTRAGWRVTRTTSGEELVSGRPPYSR